MGTTKQNQDLDNTWIIDSSNDTYILGKNAKITTSGEFAIEVLDGSNNVMADETGTTISNTSYDELVAGLPQGSVLLCGPNAGQAPPPNGEKHVEAK